MQNREYSRLAKFLQKEVGVLGEDVKRLKERFSSIGVKQEKISQEFRQLNISVEKVKVYDTGELGDDYNVNSVKGYTNIEIPDMIEPLAQGYEEFKNSVKEDRQPLTSLERSLKIQSWVNQW